MQVLDWQLIIKENGSAVWQTVYRLLGNNTDSADCFQDTFISALEVAKRQRVRNITALLIHLATARAIDRLRQRNRQIYRRTDLDVLDAVPCSNSGPVQQTQTKELIVQLRNALAHLPPKEAKVFCLRYLSDMSYRQIAKELCISTNAAGVLLHRAKAKLREALAPQSIDNDRIIS